MQCGTLIQDVSVTGVTILVVLWIHACLGQSMRGIVYKINSSLRAVLELLPRANSQFIQRPCSELFCVLNSIQKDFLDDRVGVCVQFVQCDVKSDT